MRASRREGGRLSPLLTRCTFIVGMVISAYLGASSVDFSEPQSTTIVKEAMAFDGASVPEKMTREKNNIFPASSPLTDGSFNTQKKSPKTALSTVAISDMKPNCFPTALCRSQIKKFTMERTHGFNVGRSSGLKWLTKHLHLLGQAAGKMQSPVILDIGAGKYGPEGGTDDCDALILLGLLCTPTSNCTVHAFEAIPAKARQLTDEAKKRHNTRHLTRFFHAHAIGFGKETSRLMLYPPGSPKNYNNYKVAVNNFVPPQARPHAINVPIVSLDDFLEEQGLLQPRAIFYMKVDIEGGEVGVMEGGSRALAMGAIDYFSFEYGFTWSVVYRNISLATGQRGKRFGRNPGMNTHDGAWQVGPIIDRSAYEASGGNSLLSMVKLLSSRGYDSYLINSLDKKDPPVLVPIYDDFFIEPQSELCMHDPYIYQWKGHEHSSDKRLNCWNDVFVARRGMPKKYLLDVFGTPAGVTFSECKCL